MYTVEKTYNFEAGHRLMDYDGKCTNIHGHNYVLLVGIEKEKLTNDMVEDFYAISVTLKKHIDRIDHSTILNINDDFWIKTLRDNKQKIYILKGNPTAENMARHFYETIKVDFPDIKYVSIEETPGSKATYQET